MTFLAEPFKGEKSHSVNGAISSLREYLNNETPLTVELIYFSPVQSNEDLFVLNFLISAFSDQERHVIPVLDNITKEEADESWITIYKWVGHTFYF